MGNDIKEESIPEAWLQRSQQQTKKFSKLSPEQRKAWGFTKPSLKAQQNSDEKKHPSK